MTTPTPLLGVECAHYFTNQLGKFRAARECLAPPRRVVRLECKDDPVTANGASTLLLKQLILNSSFIEIKAIYHEIGNTLNG